MMFFFSPLGFEGELFKFCKEDNLEWLQMKLLWGLLLFMFFSHCCYVVFYSVSFSVESQEQHWFKKKKSL